MYAQWFDHVNARFASNGCAFFVGLQPRHSEPEKMNFLTSAWNMRNRAYMTPSVVVSAYSHREPLRRRGDLGVLKPT